jgi:hypothetical protein
VIAGSVKNATFVFVTIAEKTLVKSKKMFFQTAHFAMIKWNQEKVSS